MVEAECFENAATIAVEKIFTSEKNVLNKYSFSAIILTKQIPYFLDEESDGIFFETKVFYTPLVMADAGFHVEAAKLQSYLDKIEQEENEQ